MLRIGIEQPPDHALVPRVIFPRLTFEELDASLAQSNSDLDAFVSKNQVLWSGKKVRNDLQVSDWFVGISNYLAHRCACRSALSNGAMK
jgi:hypothetical protein